jgi:hypothetical protein
MEKKLNYMAMQISQRKGGGKGWVEVSVKYV